MTKRRIHAEPRKPWTTAEDRLIRQRFPHEPTVDLMPALPGRTLSTIYQRGYRLGLKKTAKYLASPAAHRLDGVKGMGSRFQKGQKAWNKGLHYMPGGRIRDGWFKKGQISVRWDQDAYCVGALRLNSDGGLDIKVLPHGNRPGLYAWEPLARYVWRTERGPIPKGMAVRAINGDLDDTRIENLYLATRADLMRQNTIHNYPKPIARAVQLRGALNRKINRLEREQRGENA